MREKVWDVVVVGGANMDYLVRGPRLPAPGETVRGEDFHDAPGGKGANQAVAAARLGARVAFVGRIGDDVRGARILERFRDEGVETGLVVRDASAPTGVALVMVDRDAEKQILTAPGANCELAVADIEAAAAVLASTRCLLTQLEVPVDCVLAAIRHARASGARVVLDPAPPVPLLDEIFPLVDVIRPNAGEARALTGIDVRDRASAHLAADVLISRGVGAVVVQAGGEGNLVVSRDVAGFLPRLPVESVDATGAGDAFAAALAVELVEGRPLLEAARFANAAAALATTGLGAQAGFPTRDDVRELLASIDDFVTR